MQRLYIGCNSDALLEFFVWRLVRAPGIRIADGREKVTPEQSPELLWCLKNHTFHLAKGSKPVHSDKLTYVSLRSMGEFPVGKFGFWFLVFS